MSNNPERRRTQRSALGKPVFIVLLASIVLAGVFLFAMLSLTRENGIEGVSTLDDNAPPLDRTLTPTPDANAPLTEEVDLDREEPGEAPASQEPETQEVPAPRGQSDNRALDTDRTGGASTQTQ